MSELSDEASESEQLGASLSLWLGETLLRPEELDVPLDLHTACSIGQYDVVSECIKRGEVNLDSKNIGGWTPLMYAAYIGHDNIANLLLEAGVSVNASTGKGLTPLMLAASCGNESIAYFLLQQGADLELKDSGGWTALLHCTSTGHQQMVKFLLDNNANVNVKEPDSGFTPLMEAAASGHEIIVQYLLDHGVKVDEQNAKGETARALAMMYGHTKIASLIDMRSPKAKPGHFEDLSSSEDSDSATPRLRLSRTRAKGPSIHDGPQAIAKFRVGGSSKHCEPPAAPPGYMTFHTVGEQSEDIRYRDVTSPINELDGQSNSSRDESPFFDNDMPTMRSSSSGSEGLPRVVGLSREGSLESNEDSDQAKTSCSRRANKAHYSKGKGRHGSSDSVQPSGPGDCGMRSAVGPPPSYTGPKDLAEFLEQIGFSKYLPLLEEQDIDLRIFLTLTENDLKEVGITLFGPKRKMTSAIARWHSSARPPSDALEQAYADQLEAEMQEMAIQLHKRCEEAESLQAQVLQEKELRTVMEGCLMEDKMAWRRVHSELVENHRLAQDISATLEKNQHCRTELLSRLGPLLGGDQEKGPLLGGDQVKGPLLGGDQVKGPLLGGDQVKGPLLGGDQVKGPLLGGDQVKGPLLGGDQVKGPLLGGDQEKGPLLGGDQEKGPLLGGDQEKGPLLGGDQEKGPLLGGDQEKGHAGVDEEGLKSTSVAELVKKMDSYEEEFGRTLQTVLQSLRRLSVPEKVTDSWEQP